MNGILRCSLVNCQFRLVAVLAVMLAMLASVDAQTNETVSRARPPAPRRPSIILIVADNVGYGDLGCYGQAKIKTPALDQLAGEGMRFTSFYAASSEDAPSRAAILTGIQPSHSRLGFNQLLGTNAATIAMQLKRLGYHTGFIGEWGLGDMAPFRPQDKGFDEFAGFLSSAHAQDYYTDRIWRHDPTTAFEGQAVFPENEGGHHGRFMPDLLGTAAENFVNNNKPDRFNIYRPFFLVLALPFPHNSPGPAENPYSGESWPAAAKDRAALITHMDEIVGSLMSKLAQLKINTNTAVFFTSVNGPKKEGAMDPAFFNSTGGLRGLQGTVYEGGIRVPMIVRWPARINPGQTSDLLWTGWDFLPTAIEVALGRVPDHIDGVSILPTLRGRSQPERRAAYYWETSTPPVQQGVRLGVWKGVQVADTNVFELYDLKADPGEKNNVANRHKDVVKELEKIMGAAGAKPNAAPAAR